MINDFWEQILKAENLGIPNLFTEVIYLFPIKSYSKNGKFGTYREIYISNKKQLPLLSTFLRLKYMKTIHG